ncbi:uncharacterized protein LACBIDRAFT_321090 [Laccaria bicolor S238N-H82]|uniref:Predicted protein n=1 Tax=Laccaria bicolor (strain S238N-H82 / ATCC MYA-4686) TaxID=486041 RepID=B0CNQ8_LACBS|nr:uncharacterized protein LACBIDRAFT_321090 [Laccaria bicolor S238N-H82]EDR15977.1 predicted protein [Laccaria bicolor S238N-H82]|eukprot:XP_001874185.1 predicted protein [Laccaria bicolor S238N-H82]
MSLVSATVTATTEQRSLEVSLALQTSSISSPSRPRARSIRWDPKVDHPPTSLPENQGRSRRGSYPSPYANNLRSSRTRSSSAPPSPSSPISPSPSSIHPSPPSPSHSIESRNPPLSFENSARRSVPCPSPHANNNVCSSTRSPAAPSPSIERRDPPTPSSKSKGRRSVPHPSPFSNNFRFSTRSSSASLSPSIESMDCTPPSPLLTSETSGRLCAQYLYASLGPVLPSPPSSSLSSSSPNQNPLSLPLDQYISHLISHTHFPFSIVPCTLILVRNLRKSFLADTKRNKHVACVIDPHKLWVGLSIAAAQAHCPYISDVKDLRCWTAVTGIPMKDMGSVARAYRVVMGRDAVFDGREVERMTQELLGMHPLHRVPVSYHTLLARILTRFLDPFWGYTRILQQQITNNLLHVPPSL